MTSALRKFPRRAPEVAGIGFISEVFNGDPPHEPNGCIAQAWNSAEIIRLWTLILNELRPGAAGAEDMKVLMFGWEFPPYISGGLGTACYGITRSLSAQGVGYNICPARHSTPATVPRNPTSPCFGCRHSPVGSVSPWKIRIFPWLPGIPDNRIRPATLLGESRI